MTATQPSVPRATAPQPVPARMRAVVQDRYGNADALRLDEVATPTPGAGEVLLEVHAAGVNRGTWHLVTGLPYLMRLMGFGLRRPAQRVLGSDVAGRVVALGEGVTDLRIGDEVLGIGIGAFASYAVARADKLVRRPAGLPVEQAAVVPISGMTAYAAVHTEGRARAGQRVLVLGASGGVGSWVVQLAHAAGAHVTGVASAAKADHVRSLGAERVIDYASSDPTEGPERYDVIIDMGGRHPLRRLRRVLAPTGTLVIVGGEGGGRVTGGFGRQLRAVALDRFVPQRLVMLMAPEHRDALASVVEAIEAGHVTPAVGAAYPLEAVADAVTDLVAGRVRGAAVIRVRAA